VLQALSFSLPAGQALQLTWPNGEGKTSLLRCLAGFLHAEEGSIHWRGVDIARHRDPLYRDLAYLGHETALKGDLSILENLRLACAMRCGAADEQIEAQLRRLELPESAWHRPVRQLSAGQQRRAALARLMLWEATLWLLDEPAVNLDARGQAALAELIGDFLQQGGSVILATHSALPLPAASSRIWSRPAEAA